MRQHMWYVLTILLWLVLSGYYFFNGISNGVKISSYVQTHCLLKRSYLEKCGKRYSLIGANKCIQPKWLIVYIDYETNENATIAGPVYWVKSYRYDGSGQQYGLEKYKIGKIYSCYHSSIYRSLPVLWDKPSFDVVFINMFYACLYMFILICPLCYYCIKYRSNNNHNRRRQIILPRTHVAPPTVFVEENIQLAPPPPYTPSTVSVLEENIPLTPPPPPYMPPTVSGEQENIPSTPPPPYVPSTRSRLETQNISTLSMPNLVFT